MGIESYSTTASSNNATPPAGWPEGMTPSSVNDTGRQMMADIRAWYESAEWINFGFTHSFVGANSFAIGGGVDRTAFYHVGRRIRATGFLTGTIYGSITAASYSAPTNTITVSWDAGSLQSESLSVALHALSHTSLPTVIARVGTKLLFPGLSSAPVGWAIDAAAAYNGAAIRVVTGLSGGTGGSVDFATAFAAGRSSDPYTLQVADIPTHSHTGPSHTHDMTHTHTLTTVSITAIHSLNEVGTAVRTTDQESARTTSGPSVTTTGAGGTGATGSTGGGGGHSHGLPSFFVKYVDACICVKT